ncbi:MAG: sulfite exporter TauE/SafE family protein [Bacteroidetes bacterium]|nr:sulfite exporter TauE/SafE family protein [Bacteroidota bacterium]
MIWTAFVIGLFGSLHCLGMCGPLVIALPQSSGWKAMLYHSGRILAYAGIGMLIGLFGKGINLAGFQQSISILSGILVILFGMGLLRKRTSWPPFFIKLYQRWSQSTDLLSVFLLGFLNGLLPCGMVYVAMAGALIEQDLLRGALYMMAFGAGTLPMMLGISWSKHLWKGNLRRKLNRLVPVFTICIGILFLLRGMNLGIPYVSPKIQNQSVMDCCAPGE